MEVEKYNMLRETVVYQLKRYIAQDILEGKDIGLDETTSLLEWGIINSLELVGLLSFVRERFGCDIPSDKLVAESFASVSAIADLVLAQLSEGTVDGDP